MMVCIAGRKFPLLGGAQNMASVLFGPFNLDQGLNHFKGNKDGLIELISSGISFCFDSRHRHVELAVSFKLDSKQLYSFAFMSMCNKTIEDVFTNIKELIHRE